MVLLCEKRKEIISGRAFYHMPSPFCTLKITIEEKYNDVKLEHAIRELERIHPTIRSVVVQEDGRLWFRESERRVRIHRYSDEGNDWKTVYKEEASETLDLRIEPGVKLAVLEHQDCFELLLMFHHIYADGISAKQLLADLLSVYDKCIRMPVKESLSDVDIGRFGEHKAVASEEASRKVEDVLQVWNQNKDAFDFETFGKMNELHHKLARYEVTTGSVAEADFLKLRERCKTWKVTVNSALVTAILAGICEDEVKTVIPINIRPLLGLEREEGLANLASSVGLDLSYKRELSFWENVAVIHRVIQETRLNTENCVKQLHTFMRLHEDVFGAGYYAQYGMYKNQDMTKALQDVLALDIRRKTLDCSNIGALSCEDLSGEITIRDCYAIPNYTVTCNWMFGAVSFRNTLNLSFVYSSRRISCKAADEIMGRIIRCLCEMI